MPEEQAQTSIPEMVDDVRAGKMPRRNFIKKLTTMGISAAGVGAIVATAAGPSASALISHTHMNNHTEKKHIELHNQHLIHQGNRNTGALQNDYSEHAVVEDSLYREPLVGHAAIMSRKNVIMQATSDGNITLKNRIAHGNQVVAEWVARGTHTGDLPGLPASGRPFELHGVTVVVRHEGKIVREALYYSVDELRRQLS